MADTTICLPPLKIGIINPDGSLSGRTFEVEDPREAWCRHWNELNPGSMAIPLSELGSDASGQL